MCYNPEFFATSVLLFSGACVSAFISILFPFADTIWGSVINGIITGGTLTLQLLALAYYAHPSVLATCKAQCVWSVSFVLAMLAHIVFYISQCYFVPQELVAARWLLYNIVYTIPFFAFPPTGQIEAEFSVSPLRISEAHSYEISLPAVSVRQTSGSWGWYLVGIVWGHGCYMVGELFPGYFITYAGVIGAFFCLIAAVVNSLDKKLEYDIALLFCHAWDLNGVSIMFITIFNLSDKIGPVSTNVLVLFFGLGLQKACWRQGSTLTTEHDALLFIFPVTLATDLTQLLLYTTEDLSISRMDFWYMLGLQEAISLFINTGTKDWFLFKIQMFRGKVFAKDNPLIYSRSFEIIRGKASIDMLSEHVSLLVIVISVLGGLAAEAAGATKLNCTAICGEVDPWPVLQCLGVVFVVRLGVMFVEKRMLASIAREVVDAPDSYNAFSSQAFFGLGSSPLRKNLKEMSLEGDSVSLLEVSDSQVFAEGRERNTNALIKHGKRDALQALVLLSVTVIIEILTINRKPGTAG